LFVVPFEYPHAFSRGFSPLVSFFSSIFSLAILHTTFDRLLSLLKMPKLLSILRERVSGK